MAAESIRIRQSCSHPLRANTGWQNREWRCQSAEELHGHSPECQGETPSWNLFASGWSPERESWYRHTLLCKSARMLYPRTLLLYLGELGVRPGTGAMQFLALHLTASVLAPRDRGTGRVFCAKGMKPYTALLPVGCELQCIA